MSGPLYARIVNESRSRSYPVVDWLSLSVDKGEHDTQTMATLVVRPDAYWLNETSLGFDGTEWGAEISLDVWWQDTTTPIFSGPISNVEMSEDRSGATMLLQFEHWTRHFLSRRVILSSGGTKLDLGSFKADTAMATLLRRNGFNSGTTVTPIGYPASRTDWDSWAVTTAAGTSSHATKINPDFSNGRRLLEECDALMDAHGMDLTWAETSAGVFTITVAPAYQNNDLTNSVVLDLRRGTLTEYSEKVDYSSLENVLLLKITGGTQLFTQDATSVAAYGVYEGAYAGQQYDAKAAAEQGTYLKGRFANPIIYFDCTAVDQPGATFNVDYAVRDLVTIRSGAWNRSASKLVVGAKIQASGRDVSCAVALGNPAGGYDAQTREGDGTLLGRGRGLGSRYKIATP